ncbi:DUF58 domain-containing protein [Aliikangiella maris]|uniref:DUF58 domain-containing protein n=2 Tax=Aliikangiella maris TaxID=3162458 RepID=A0ABV3MJP2_9GAMM
MSEWAKSPHHIIASHHEELADDFKLGIDLTLGQLIEARHSPIIQWLSPNAKVKTNRVGGFRSRFKGRGMDFDESRIYQIGDDIRNIDWRVTARTGTTHTKLFKEERERPVFVILDQMPSMFFGTAQVFKSILASRITAQLMWHTLTNGDRFGALLFGEKHHLEMKPSNNRRNCMRLLNRIVESHQQTLLDVFQSNKQPEAKPDFAFADTLKRLKYLAKPGTLIHIISDFNHFDEQSRAHLSKLSQHTDVHCILINDPIEKNLPPAGFYGISNGSQVGLLNTTNNQIRQQYQNAYQAKVEKIKAFALSHKGIFTQVDTNFQQNSLGHQPTVAQPMTQQENPSRGVK